MLLRSLRIREDGGKIISKAQANTGSVDSSGAVKRLFSVDSCWCHDEYELCCTTAQWCAEWSSSAGRDLCFGSSAMALHGCLRRDEGTVSSGSSSAAREEEYHFSKLLRMDRGALANVLQTPNKSRVTETKNAGPSTDYLKLVLASSAGHARVEAVCGSRAFQDRDHEDQHGLAVYSGRPTEGIPT